MTDQLRAIAHRASLLAPGPLIPHQRGGRFERRSGRVYHAYDPPVASLNHVAVLDDSLPAAALLAEAAEWFADRPVWGVRLDPALDLAVERAVVAAGWALVEDELNLVLPEPPAQPPTPPPAGLTIAPVVDEAGLRDYVTLTSRVFGAEEQPLPLPPGPDGRAPTIDDLLFPTLAAAVGPEVALFVGSVAGEPAATAGLLVIDEIAFIIGVATLPAHRRHGYAEALTWAAVCEGARRGCHAAALSASAMGRPIYERMGFLPACHLRCYQAPGRDGNADGRR